MITLLDGPLGTELTTRGVATKLPRWSAEALESAPEVISAIHRDYAAAGATVHTTNTFRTKRRTVGDHWRRLTEQAVAIARQSVPAGHRIAGSISPLEDCYRPDLSPGEDSREEHREMAQALANFGCDLLLCETFPAVQEALVAVGQAVDTGVETWIALTAGPDATLLSPQQMAKAAEQAVDLGAAAVLVNCTPAMRTLEYVQAIASRNVGVPLGAYANAGRADEHLGWQTTGEFASRERGAARYRELALKWVQAGATLIGGCCGTSPRHIAALNEVFSSGHDTNVHRGCPEGIDTQ